MITVKHVLFLQEYIGHFLNFETENLFHYDATDKKAVKALSQIISHLYRDRNKYDHEATYKFIRNAINTYNHDAKDKYCISEITWVVLLKQWMKQAKLLDNDRLSDIYCRNQLLQQLNQIYEDYLRLFEVYSKSYETAEAISMASIIAQKRSARVFHNFLCTLVHVGQEPTAKALHFFIQLIHLSCTTHPEFNSDKTKSTMDDLSIMVAEVMGWALELKLFSNPIESDSEEGFSYGPRTSTKAVEKLSLSVEDICCLKTLLGSVLEQPSFSQSYNSRLYSGNKISGLRFEEAKSLLWSTNIDLTIHQLQKLSVSSPVSPVKKESSPRGKLGEILEKLPSPRSSRKASTQSTGTLPKPAEKDKTSPRSEKAKKQDSKLGFGSLSQYIQRKRKTKETKPTLIHHEDVKTHLSRLNSNERRNSAPPSSFESFSAYSSSQSSGEHICISHKRRNSSSEYIAAKLNTQSKSKQDKHGEVLVFSHYGKQPREKENRSPKKGKEKLHEKSRPMHPSKERRHTKNIRYGKKMRGL